MMPIAEFLNAARHLSSLCWRAPFFKNVWVFEDISRTNRHLPSDGQLNRLTQPSSGPGMAGGWLGAAQNAGNENVRRQRYCSRLKAWSRQNFTIRPLFLTVKNHNQSISSSFSHLSVSVSIFEMETEGSCFMVEPVNPLPNRKRHQLIGCSPSHTISRFVRLPLCAECT